MFLTTEHTVEVKLVHTCQRSSVAFISEMSKGLSRLEVEYYVRRYQGLVDDRGCD